MLCLNERGQWVSPSACTPACPVPSSSNSGYHAFPLQPKINCIDSLESLDTQPYRQWPWRLFPFASDLGTVGCLLNKPRLGLLGWVIAIPYYFYAILRQPDTNRRKDEILYQALANGIFPLLEAKVGVKLGDKLHQFISKNRLTVARPVLKQTHFKLLGGLLGLVTLTPTVGDPASQQICHKYQSRHLNITI